MAIAMLLEWTDMDEDKYLDLIDKVALGDADVPGCRAASGGRDRRAGGASSTSGSPKRRSIASSRRSCSRRRARRTIEPPIGQRLARLRDPHTAGRPRAAALASQAWPAGIVVGERRHTAARHASPSCSRTSRGRPAPPAARRRCTPSCSPSTTGSCAQAFAGHGGYEVRHRGRRLLRRLLERPTTRSPRRSTRQRSLAGSVWPEGVEVRVRMGA